MTRPKHIASTLKHILNNPVLVQVMDKTSDPREWVPVIDEYWICDLDKRKPSPAEFDDDGTIIKAGSYDMASFVYSLYDRGAVIDIPKYRSYTPTTVNEGQYKVRHGGTRGKVIGATSNMETFNFSIRIVDDNIVSKETYGYPRNYKMTDHTGAWYPGWDALDFVTTVEENKFLTENKLWDGETILFENFVTPEKWQSLYGQYYFITKAAITRVNAELNFLKNQNEKMIEKGIRAPIVGSGNDNTSWKAPSSKDETTKGKQIIIQKTEFKVDLPEYDLEFIEYPLQSDALIVIREKIKILRQALSKFRFITRCIELAASNKGFNVIPHWLKNVYWEDDFKEKPKSRTYWNRLKIVQPTVGELSVAIRYRKSSKRIWVKK